MNQGFIEVNQKFDRVFAGIQDIKDIVSGEVGQLKERVTRIENTIGVGQ